MAMSEKPPVDSSGDDQRPGLVRWYGYQIAGVVCLLAIPIPVWLVTDVIRQPGMNTALIFLGLVMVILVSEAWYDLARWRRNAGRPTTHSQQLAKIGMTLGWLLVVLAALVLLVQFLGVWKPVG